MRSVPVVTLAALLLATACAPKTAAPAAVAVVDTTAVKTGLDSLRARYIALRTGDDAAGLAGLYSADAGIDQYGLPRLRGRPSIEAAFKTDMAARKYTLLEIMPLNLEARTNTDASEIGTYHEMSDSSGTKGHAWGRYLAAFTKESDGMWRLVYLIGFPDSTRVDK